MADLNVAKSELILGGQKSGKTARAESRAAAWLAQSPSHHAVYIATAQARDDEMRERIARHRQDRAGRVPRMSTVEEPAELARAIAAHSVAHTLVVVDCLTLWLTGILLPPTGFSEEKTAVDRTSRELSAMVSGAVAAAQSPLVLACERVTLMAAGLPLLLKDAE